MDITFTNTTARNNHSDFAIVTIPVGKHRRRIERLARAITADSSAEPHLFSHQARMAGTRLSQVLREKLLDFAFAGSGALLLTGLDPGDVPPTPNTPLGAPTRHTLMAKQTAVVLSAFGQLVGYRPECAGELVQTIVPVRNDQRLQVSTGSAVVLESHTEQCVNMTTRPDFIALGCLRGDPQAATYLMSARQIVAHLTPPVVDLLRDQAYLTRIDTSFVQSGVLDQLRGPMPVLDGNRLDPVVSYDEDLMTARDPAHTAALGEVTALWHTHRHAVVLRRGDLLIIDNSRVIHGRSAFRPQWDGGDRWLCRLQALANVAVARAGAQPGSSIIEPEAC